MSQPLRLLVVEDSEIDHQVLVATLRREGFAIEATRVEVPGALSKALREGHWDAVVTDHHMPMFDALGAIAVVKDYDPLMPVIVVSGEPAESLAVEVLDAGAEDCVLKGGLRRIAATLRRALRAADCRRRLKAAEAELAGAASTRATPIYLGEHEGAALGHGLRTDVLEPLEQAASGLAQPTPDAASLATARTGLALARAGAEALHRRLAPVSLGSGIVSALASLVSAFGKRTGMAAEFRCNRERLDCPDETSITLYRIAQDSLDNVARHAKASQVSVELFDGPAALTLEVTDNGVGASATALAPERAPGVAAMAERARLQGGTLQATGIEGLGTTILLTMQRRPGG